MAFYYAGIGSRETPQYVLELMERVAWRLMQRGFILRSGHAPGADQAFERGAHGLAAIYLPYRGFQRSTPIVDDPYLPDIFEKPSIDAILASEKLHPYLPGRYRPYYARNLHILCGERPLAVLHRPTASFGCSRFVICWADTTRGGTGQTIQVAEEKLGLPVWNLADKKVYDETFEWAHAEE